jgi:hypothetical protein
MISCGILYSRWIAGATKSQIVVVWVVVGRARPGFASSSEGVLDWGLFASEIFESIRVGRG